MLRPGLVLAALLGLTACEEWHLSINRDGLVLVSVIGDGADRGRYRLRTRDADGISRILDLPASGTVALAAPSDGELEVTLLMPKGCAVSGPNPQRLSLFAGQEERVSFEVRCS